MAAGTGDVLMSRLREGRANTARGAAHFLRETVGRVRYGGAKGQLTVRADSGFYTHAVVAVCRKTKVRFSITIRQRASLRNRIGQFGDDTTAIVISVVYRGCAIPVAWRILRANQRGAWMDPIVELLQALAPAVPREMTVVVLCDRGLASPKIVETDPGSGLASLHEVSEKRYFLRRGRSAAAGPRLRFPSGYRLDRERDRFRQRRRQTPLHPAGGLVRGTGGAVDHPDRPAARPSWGELVRTALLDRVGVQGGQELGLAMAKDP